MTAGPGFRPGDRVVIVGGTFAGTQGTVLSPREVLGRCPGAPISPDVYTGRAYWLLIEVFGREMPIELEACQLAPAGEGGA
jgi:transcription antitermination factor NusG